MSDRPENEFKAWSNFKDASKEAKLDALLDLYMNLDLLDSNDSIGAGFAAFERLGEECRFDQAAYVARSLATELASLERFDEAAEILETALAFSLWLSDFELGMLYYVSGRNHIDRQQLAMGEVLLEKSVGILEAENERFAAYACKELAEARVELRDHEGAIKAFSKSISLLETCAEAGTVGYVKRRLGEVLLNQKQFLMAEKYLKDAVAILEFTDWVEEKCHAELALGRFFLDVEDFEEAAELFESLAAKRSEPRFSSIAAQASFYMHKLQVLTGNGPLLKPQVDSLTAVLNATGLFDLADSVAELSELPRKNQTESERKS